MVAVNGDGQIGIVECKRATNPECRRWVIGQIFEYAAGLWKIDYEDFRRSLAANGFVKEGWDDETFGGLVSGNLKAGRFQLFIAVDEMTDRLRKRLERTVTFLNSGLPEVEILAIEVPRAGQVKTYGDDPESVPPLEPKLKPDRWTLVDEIGTPGAVHAADDLMGWADRLGPRGVEVRPTPTQCVIEVSGKPLFRLRPQELQVALSAVVTKDQPWDERTVKLVEDLGELGLELQQGKPRAPLELLANDDVRETFLALMEGHLAAVAGQQ